jgi:ABC-type transport system substrate-binding protein/class 3 adenylate cyclase
MASANGERRIVSVVVADVAGSTAIGERLGPERSKFLFDDVVRLMSEGVVAFDGTVAQLTGDGLLALFGAPVAHEDDAERAVRAALAVQRALRDYAGEVESAYGVELAARVAVNTGPAVISENADDGTVRYNALGDTVNVAARLQAAAPAQAVVVGPATARQVESWFELEPLGALDLRGRSAPVDAFVVAGEREEPRPAPARPLVGRGFELAVLERIVDDLEDGHGVVVGITGEAGIGKTRLMAEVARRHCDRVQVIEGRGVSYAQNFPYWPIRELLREWLGVGASTPEARVRLELKAALARVLREDAESAYPFIATLLGVTLERDAAGRLRELSREGVQHATFRAFRELVCRLGDAQPLLLLLDDLHWADESTLELLEDLLGVTDESAVAVVLLHRPERDHVSWRLGEHARQRYPHRYREIELRPLPDDASRALVAQAADGELPAPVVALLAERAGGNPFFLEEALRDLIERGALRQANGRYELAVEAEMLAIPALVQGALQARLDRLDAETQESLSLAAVIGRTFGMPLLDELLPHERVLAALSELQRLDLVVEHRRRPTREYRFRHGLVQEVAYARLLEPRRRALHRRVGEALESLAAGSPEEVYPLLARHFAEADDAEKAADYLLRAGDAARAVYADQEALDHYRAARRFLARLGDSNRARETLFKIALAHHLAFDFEQAESAYDEAFCCAEAEPERADPTERVEAVIGPPGNPAPGEIYTTEGGSVVEHLFCGLLHIDADLNVMPAAADNFRVSGDGLTYLFQLRDGLRWSDGHPVTAADFILAWQRHRTGGSHSSFLLADVDSAEALDDRTIEVRLHEPRSYFPYIMALPSAAPIPRHRVEELGDDWRLPENLVSNGPFVLSELGDDHAVLHANPHWNGARGNVRELVFHFRPSKPEVLEDWHAGRYDVIQVNELADVAESELAEPLAGLTTAYLGFRGDRPPFSSLDVRRAFFHGVDTTALGEALGVKRVAETGGFIPPAIPGHSPRLHRGYDPELAAELLARAGYPGGRGMPELEMLLSGHVRDGGEALVEQFARLGVRVRAEPVVYEPGTWTSSTAELWVSGWTADYPDPDGMFRGLVQHGLTPLYCDEEIEALLERARSMLDQDERLRLYHEIDRVWVGERAAMLPLAYGRLVVIRRPWIEGVWGNPLTLAHFDRAMKLPVAAEVAASA